jgi:hypothetical protein
LNEKVSYNTNLHLNKQKFLVGQFFHPIISNFLNLILINFISKTYLSNHKFLKCPKQCDGKSNFTTKKRFWMNDTNIWTPYDKKISTLIEKHDEKKQPCLILPIFEKKYSIFKERRQQINNFDLSSKPREIIRGTWFLWQQNDTRRNPPTVIPYTERLAEHLEQEFQKYIKESENVFFTQNVIDLTNKTHFIVFHTKEIVLQYAYSQFRNEEKKSQEDDEKQFLQYPNYSLKSEFPVRKLDWEDDSLEQHLNPFTLGVSVSRGFNSIPEQSRNLEWRWFYNDEVLHETLEKKKANATFWKPLTLHNSLMMEFLRVKGKKQIPLIQQEMFRNLTVDFDKECMTGEYSDVYSDDNQLKQFSFPIRRACWFWIDSDEMLQDVLYPLREEICLKLNTMVENQEFNTPLDLDDSHKRYCVLESAFRGKQKIHNHEKFEWPIVKGFLPQVFSLYEENK